MENLPLPSQILYHTRRHSVILNLSTRKPTFNFASCQKEAERNRSTSTIMNVDRTRSHSNRFILPGGELSTTDRDGMSLRERIFGRIISMTGTSKVSKRSVIDLSYIMTGASEVFASMDTDTIYRWAKDSYIFMEKTYGRDNIVSAVLHLDENNPHIHLDVVPIFEENGKARLCASAFHGEGAYAKIRHDYWEHMKGYGFDPMRENVRTRHYSLEDLQSDIKDKVLECKVQHDLIEKEVLSLEKRKSSLERDILELEEEVRIMGSKLSPFIHTEDLHGRWDEPSVSFTSEEPCIQSTQRTIQEEYISIRKEIIRLSHLPKEASRNISAIASKAASLQKKVDGEHYEKDIREMDSRMKESSAKFSALSFREKRLSGKLAEEEKACRELDKFLSGEGIVQEQKRKDLVRILKRLSAPFGKHVEEVFPNALLPEKKLKDSVPWLREMDMERLVQVSVPSFKKEEWKPADEGLIRIGEKRDIPLNISYLTCGDSPTSYPRRINWEILTEEEKEEIISSFEEVFLRMPSYIQGELKMMENGRFKVGIDYPYSKGEVDFRVALWANNQDLLSGNGYIFPWSTRIPLEEEGLTKEKDFEYMEKISSPLWTGRWERKE